jgi:hypothetical protein
VGEVRRSIENIEAASVIAYMLAKGEKMLNIAPEIDRELILEPLGCFVVITPSIITMAMPGMSPTENAPRASVATEP